MYDFLSTVYADVMEKDMTLRVDQPVQLIGLGRKMCIVGYVPCDFFPDSIVYELTLSNTFKVSDNVVFEYINKNKYSYQITASVKKIKEGQICIDKYVDILEYTCNGNAYVSKRYMTFCERLVENTITENNWPFLKMPKCFEYRDSSVWYTPKKNELLFTKNDNKKAAIAQFFLCLCIYSNPINGRIEYQLFNPKELVRIDNL